MGNSQSQVAAEAKKDGATCPMGYGQGESDGSEPAKKDEKMSSGSGKEACPIDYKNMSPEEVKKKIYDVYGQELDPRNKMPVEGNELPSPGQKARLSTDREKSTIPKSGTDETWTYPSPQQFYNALMRKGKGDDVSEGDMDVVVQIHNQMNERTWKEVLRWEEKNHCDCENLKLEHFVGKPHQLSPTARMHTWMGGEPPFDRHDWTIDRCGKEVRYVIDYYYKDPDQTKKDEERIHIHVRPALDSFENAFDRFRMKFSQGKARAPPELEQESPENAIQSLKKQVASGTLDSEEFEKLASLTGEKIRDLSKQVGEKCAGLAEVLSSCQGEEECEQASLAANYCAATTICPLQADAFMSSMTANKDAGAAYEQMTDCLQRFHVVARRVINQEAGLAQLGPESTSSSGAKTPPEATAAASAKET